MKSTTFDGNEWKTFRLSFSETAKQMLTNMSLEEKIALMSGSMVREEVLGAVRGNSKAHYNEAPYKAGGNKERQIPAMFFADGTRGIVCGRGETTCFPVSCMRAATFNPELEEKIGTALGEEAMAMGANLFGGVCVNLPYHPGWGRAQETYGEDPCVLSAMGRALVRGVQKTGMIACVKHFAFNSMENSRFEVDIDCSKRAEQEVFLKAFRACIDEGAGAVMTAYNSFRGNMCGQNEYLIQDILKKSWGFDGFVLSDFSWGIKDTEKSIHAGMDLEMPATYFYGEALAAAVKAGRVGEEEIDDAVLRILRTLLAHESKMGAKQKKQIHSALALECAREGITLLRNENGLLPLHKRSNRKMVVLGFLADRKNTGDRGSSHVYTEQVVTALKGIINEAKDSEVIYYEGDNTFHCKRLAKDADSVIIVVGNDYHDEGELLSANASEIIVNQSGGDRSDNMRVKKRDLDMIEAVSEVRKDAIVAVYGGSTILMNEWYEKVGAILLLYYPGMEGGTAFADVLFGNVNPSGKLPFVIPKEESDLPKIDWKTVEQTYQYYHGYTLLEKRGVRPLYPFGFGLSYTSFEIRCISTHIEKDTIVANVGVTNTGSTAGAEVVQMYVSMPNSIVDRAVKILVAFEKVFLRAGEQKEMTLKSSLHDLAYYDEQEGFVIEKTEYTVFIGVGI